MRLNIEWMAPWRHGGPWRAWVWHTYRQEGAGGIWLLGLFVHWTRKATTHGIGLSVLL